MTFDIITEYWTDIRTPLGKLRLIADTESLTHVEFTERCPVPQDACIETKLLQQAKRELLEYFKGDRTEFSVPLNPAGTDFQRAVWNELLRIPHGETQTYLDIATKLGNPKSLRAVGAANGKNPIAIIIPCHRVIGSDGKLIGYGGGIDKKIWLLKHEGAAIMI